MNSNNVALLLRNTPNVSRYVTIPFPAYAYAYAYVQVPQPKEEITLEPSGLDRDPLAGAYPVSHSSISKITSRPKGSRATASTQESLKRITI